jgi:hypothetical protein
MFRHLEHIKIHKRTREAIHLQPLPVPHHPADPPVTLPTPLAPVTPVKLAPEEVHGGNYILAVTGDIGFVNSAGVFGWTPINTKDTIIDVIQADPALSNKVYLYYREFGYFLNTDQSKRFIPSRTNKQPWTFDENGRLTDVYGFRAELTLKNAQPFQIVAGGSTRPPDHVPIAPPSIAPPPTKEEPKPEVKPPVIVVVPDFATPSNYNPAPSDPTNKWDYRQNTEVYYDPRDPVGSFIRNNKPLVIGGAVAIVMLFAVMRSK